MPNLIHIFGASGSGTTTLGQMICEKLGYTLIDADDFFWVPSDPPFTQKRPAEERIELMKKKISESENAVISGSITGWGDVFIPLFTLAIRIEMEPSLRMERLYQREKKLFGSRIEIGGDMYQKHREFIEWAKAYDFGGLEIRSRAKHDQWQKLLSCEVLLLDGAESPEVNLKKALNKINPLQP